MSSVARDRYVLTLSVEVAARSLTVATERFLRLFRRRVRSDLKPGVRYTASYRGSVLWLTDNKDAPPDRVNLPAAAKRKRRLRRKAKRRKVR